jgi:hypothetical protein
MNEQYGGGNRDQKQEPVIVKTKAAPADKAAQPLVEDKGMRGLSQLVAEMWQPGTEDNSETDTNTTTGDTQTRRTRAAGSSSNGGSSDTNNDVKGKFCAWLKEFDASVSEKDKSGKEHGDSHWRDVVDHVDKHWKSYTDTGKFAE